MSSGSRTTLRFGLAGLAVLGAGPALIRPPHTDEAGFLYLAGEVLDGMRHGADFFEINPPLAIWLSIPPVLLERATGLPAWIGWILLVLAIANVCLLICRRLLDILGAPSTLTAGFTLAIGFVFLLLPVQEFSEREHVALILILPFALLTAARAGDLRVPPSLSTTAGLLGGLGFSLKPHFLVAWLILELWLLVRLRTRSIQRPELWSLVGTGAAYLLLVLILAPDYFPMAARLAPVYQAYLHNSPATVVLMAGPVLLFIPGFALAVRSVSRESDPVRDVLSLCVLGFLLAAVLQQKGLNYHFLAAEGAGFLLLVRAWQTRPERLGWRPSGLVVRLGFLLMLLIPLLKASTLARQAVAPGGIRYGSDPDYPRVLATVRELADGEPVLSLSSNMNDGWPLTLEARTHWGSRYMHFWPMAAIYHDEILARPLSVVRPRSYQERTGFERRFSDEVVDDLKLHRPKIMVVVLPDSTEVMGGHARRFDYLGYFGSDPRFKEILGGYREVSRIGIYKLLLRESPVTPVESLDRSGAVPTRAITARDQP